jgi:hypothetical protein
MAALRSSLPLLIGAVLLFGLLTFLFGLVVGANLVGVPEPPPMTKPSPVSPSVTAPPAPIQSPAPTSSAPAPIPSAPAPAAAPMPPAPAAAPPAPAPAAPPTPSAPGSSDSTAPAVKPVKVKGFGFGEPPSAPPNSSLRGPLLEQAADAPPASPALAPADSGQAAAAVPPPPAAAAPVKESAPPMVYSVAVGRFLVESRAGDLSSAVAAKGFTPVVVVSDPPDATGWLTVTLGPQEDATQAKRLAKEAEAQGFDTWMVSWLPP